MPDPTPPPGRPEPYRARVGETAFRIDAHGDALTLRSDGEGELAGAPLNARLDFVSGAQYVLRVGADVFPVVVEAREGSRYTLNVGGQRVEVAVDDAQAMMLERFGLTDGASKAQREVRAPMPGLVLGVYVAPGEAVEAGARLVVLEAMKMENELRAAHAGTIARVHVAAGAAVGKNALLVEFEA